MSPLIAIAITTGILSAVWGWIAVAFGLISWVGFLGCTSYFASSGGYKALLQTIFCNTSGMLWALQQWLGYIPGTFAGCCATFGAAGEWRLILPSLIIGALFGYLMKASGLWLSHKTQKADAAPAVVDPA